MIRHITGSVRLNRAPEERVRYPDMVQLDLCVADVITETTLNESRTVQSLFCRQ